MAGTLDKKPDMDILCRAMAQLWDLPINDERLKKLALELEGLLKVVSRLDELDLSQAEPARLFRNCDG